MPTFVYRFAALRNGASVTVSNRFGDCNCAIVLSFMDLLLHKTNNVPILLYFVWMILYYDIHIDDKDCKASMFVSFVLFPAFLMTHYQIHCLYYWLNSSYEHWLVHNKEGFSSALFEGTLPVLACIRTEEQNGLLSQNLVCQPGFKSRTSCIWSRNFNYRVTLVQALRLWTGHTAHRGSRGIAILFHDQWH
jgi:hypothetical protein